MALQLRALSPDERSKIDRLTHAQIAPVRLASRAHIIALAARGLTAPQIAHQVQISEKAVRQWLKRFETADLDGLEDAPRSGRPPTYRPDETNRVITKARSLPPKPDQGETPPTCHWTLNRLQAELAQAELAKEGLPIKRSQIRRSQIRRILKTEQIKWQQPRTWFESNDPQFAENRVHIECQATDGAVGCLSTLGS